MSGYNFSNDDHRPHAITSDTPIDIDRDRKPQLNMDNVGSRCSCPCSRAADRRSGDDMLAVATGNSDRGSEADRAQMVSAIKAWLEQTARTDTKRLNGDQSNKDYLIEVGDLGMESIAAIQCALLRHVGCTCQQDSTFSKGDTVIQWNISPTPSGALSPRLMGMSRSLIVEFNSSDNSSVASSQIFSMQSGSSSSLLRFAGHVFDQTFDPDQPMPLTLAEFAEYDFW